jgi:glycosyltransferase involved in cell wall biosynthesis
VARIIYFSRDYTTHDHRFLSALARTDHQVYYLQLERSGHTLEDRPLPPEIERIQWAGGQKPAHLRDGLRLLADLRGVIRRVKPDLIQAGPIQRSAFLVALNGFRPLISMSWGYDLLIDARRNALWRWATLYTLKRSAVMVGDCDTIRRLGVAYGMPDERIVTFPWGIDLRHFYPRPLSFNQDPSTFNLLSTRGWEPIYGVDVIAQAFVQAARQRPELRLIMLGNGSQAARLRQIFLQGEVAERVMYPGHASYDDLPRYYSMTDLYLSASHSDGTSISLLEAMACGRPALVSDIPGNQEWVQEGVNGWLFPDGDADALERAILRAVDQRQRLPQMGQAAREIAGQRADWEKNFPELLKAYELALEVGGIRIGKS